MKHPLFTKSFTSTTSFGPGHVVGATVLVFGTILVAKTIISRGQAETRLAQRKPSENERGHYGEKESP